MRLGYTKNVLPNLCSNEFIILSALIIIILTKNEMDNTEAQKSSNYITGDLACYIGLREQIKAYSAMLSKERVFHKKEDYNQLRELRIQFKNRVDELDVFYKKNHLQDNIAIFHMLKIKLEKEIFKINQLQKQRSAYELSLRDDSASLFNQNDIKILEQPLFTYYEGSTMKKSQKEDFISYSKNPSEDFILFGDEKKVEKSKHLKSKSTFDNNPQPSKNKIIKQQPFSKNIPKIDKIPTKLDKQSKKIPSKASLTYGPANFRPSQLQKAQQQKKKAKSPEKPIQASPTNNFLQCLNSQSQLKFTIKMTKQQYKSLLQMKKRLTNQGKQ